MSGNTLRLLASSIAVCATLAASQAWALTLEVLSSRPELVSGGDALVRITGASGAPTVTVDGNDVSAAFKTNASGNWVGLVGSLKDGDNKLIAKAGGSEATLTLINHPIDGTLFAGPQQTPFLCENENHGLAPAKDSTCAAPSTVKYYYRNKGGLWKAFDPKAAARPADVAMTKTSDGKEVPLIVRQEKGVINRSAYVINILHDPTAGPLPTPTASSPASGWNGKLIYSFGPGVQANYHMGRGLGMLAAADGKFYIEDLGAGYRDLFITRGYAIAAGSLNVMGANTDDVKSAETAAKIKEHFIKEFGPPKFTIGHGASGGSMMQQLVANAYPGIIDGIMPARLFADTMTFQEPLTDCELLENVFKTGKWTREQMNAVSGKYWGYCVSNGTRYPILRVGDCDATVKDMIANEAAWKGVRCTYQDNLVNVFGRDPKTGFARNPFDNVGVQYGLGALNDGKITFDEFIDINARIGGLDNDGKIMAARMVGDPDAIKRAYETGRINEGTGEAATPFIDLRTYVDGDPLGRGDHVVDVHDRYHSFIVRARLLKYNGTATNHVMLVTASYGFPQGDSRTEGSPLATVSAQALTQMDQWLTAIAADKSDKPKARKVADDKPKDLVDACFPTKEGPLVGAIEKITDMTRCNQLFPYSADARLVAGAPATDDVLKCTLKPVDAKDYKAAPTADQLALLRKTFPEGVCDYSKPGIGQTTKLTTWAIFDKGNGEFKALASQR